MSIPVNIQSFSFSGETVEALVPSFSWIQERYTQQKAAGETPAFPYWAQVWPAAIALCEFIAASPGFISNKKVLELAAGIGLPSLLSARFCSTVIASDYIPDAVDIMQRSVLHNNIGNMQTMVIDWNHLPKQLEPDVLLLSDINYDPAAFEVLFTVLQQFIQDGVTVLLSTPQRLSGKAFMERLQPWCRQQQEVEVWFNAANVYTSVWVLQQ